MNNVGEIIDEYRRQTRDVTAPYLISNDEAISNFNEAQRQAFRRAKLGVDSTTPSITNVSVNAGDSIVRIDPRIISIRRARLESRPCPLKKRIIREMDELSPGWDSQTSRSIPTSIIVDYQTDSLFLYPTPANDDVLLMTVTREPLCDVEGYDDIPEINARYYQSCIEWMKYRAYSDEDTDLFDEKKAATALSRFENEFGPAIGAVDERFEYEHYDDVGER